MGTSPSFFSLWRLFSFTQSAKRPRAEISNKLNAINILSPSEHKKQLGLKHSSPFKTKEKSLWSAKAVIRVLQDEVCIGTLTQGTRTTLNHKIKKSIVKPQEEWAVVENAHEPIISKNIFKIANKLFLVDTRKAPSSENAYIFSGLILCKDCRQNMMLKTSYNGAKKYIHYVCSTFGNKKGCFSHRIRINTLSEIVLNRINDHLDSMEDKEPFIKKITDEICALSEDAGDIFIFDEQGKIKELTRLLVVMLIENIYVTENKDIIIEFNSFE